MSILTISPKPDLVFFLLMVGAELNHSFFAQGSKTKGKNVAKCITNLVLVLSNALHFGVKKSYAVFMF